MLKIPVPTSKLWELLEATDFSEEYRRALEPCAEVLLSRKNEFAERFESVYSQIPATRVFLDHQEEHGHLNKVWAHWYETILTGKTVQELLGFLWRIGLRHVEVNVDQSYTNAGFSIARNFMHDILEREFPAETALPAIRAVDRLLDLCLMVETVAYIENLSHCDMDIMGGIADKVRNPVTVIGGNIRRLMKKSLSDDEKNHVYEDIIEENARLERMVINIKKYIELFRREPSIIRVSLSASLDSALLRLKREVENSHIPNVEAHLDAGVDFVTGSPVEIEDMFFYLLLSCLEDPGYSGETITVSSAPDNMPERHVRIVLHCPGSMLTADDSDRVIHPFYSQGSIGTGFGLPTVLLAVRKNHGSFHIETSKSGGADFVVTLPSSG
jgi:signal transduction histidine kinase